ncbi:adenylate/guanylate cyclase domain-containing protein [Sulfitobacter sabulilitoris]|uniref:histidine kinase n=1 Tax=Sulfitobacter sabulilitoris TaxID=2562655 RepID=A0A5S3Q4W0_9RHOB|nr:adenylate/guanylate cyclase domain-containing protein [Sulfitobacter sabulilitoris]TMM51712.1 response regulator [Sulfitobacter sabulilitoris]
MAPQRHRDKLALATRISQKLMGPSEAISGYHALLIEEVRRVGPAEALADLDRIGLAAARLVEMVQSLSARSNDIATDEASQARLRHELRSPINAILGYSEMVLEDFERALPASALSDIRAMVNEARRLPVQIDAVFDPEAGTDDALSLGEEEQIAAGLEKSLSISDTGRQHLTGHILVIDDEPANRDILTRLLERRGRSVRAVGSARETYIALREERFDLVLLDILMPDTNGIEVLERIKADPDWREIPVVMVSGLNETGAIARCISIGADDYLPKPIDPVLLHARVDSCLERSHWRARERAFTKEIKFEKDRADALLHAMLPAPIIQRLNAGEAQIADRFVGATIVFADIVDFTPLVARMEAGDLVRELSNIFTAFDDLATRHSIEKIKTIGDAYMAVSGIPAQREDHARIAVDFARDILKTMSDGAVSKEGLQIRIGVHSGPVIAGLIGRKRSIYDVWGETVNLASRLESTGIAGKIQISKATKDALGTYLETVEEREHTVKGIGKVTSYFIV